jgi:integrase
MAAKSFRVGRVRVYLRGRVWYLSYSEQGRRRQPRVGTDRDEAKRMAAEVNAQLEAGAPSSLGFTPIGFPELRQQWLDHHEHVRRSSLQTISRYRTATEHLIDFIRMRSTVSRVSEFRPVHAEEFVRYLRGKRVAPNGHKNAKTRPLRDAGIRYVLETSSALLNYAQRHRHLPPYVENPFRTIEVCRLPIQDAAPVIALDNEQQLAFLQACDDWQFPIFLTALFTGLRPGELVHLLLPQDLDLTAGWLYVRNKPQLGWQVKTRNERDIPLNAELAAVLRLVVGTRKSGPVFRQRRCNADYAPPLTNYTAKQLDHEATRRLKLSSADGSDRLQRARVAQTIWRDLGVVKEDWVRNEFIRAMRIAGMPEVTAPKTLRHTFATILQDANVDPLVRNELMGHSPMASTSTRGLGMTTVYTHTRPETKRKQLEAALGGLPVGTLVSSWLANRPSAG